MGEGMGKYLSRELRIKLYDDVVTLRRSGLTYTRFIEEIYRGYRVRITKAHVSYWTRGLHNPHKGRRIPSLEFLEPSEDLAYVIGVRCGDGHAKAKKGYHYVIYLEAKDREFVEELAIRIGRVLNRPPPKVKINSDGRYYVEAKSKTLYELLKKPIDIEKISKYVEHCEKCVVMFLRGFFDSEGSVSEEWYITICNTDYELLIYVQELLKKFGIETTGPWPTTRQGTPLYDPRRGKVYTRKKDCFYLRIRASSNADFYRIVGFTIRRKQERLERRYGRRVVAEDL
jgi:intein-encoded DNA endonuclease-like protein